MGWIPDASVASKWHLKEDYSAAAKALLRDDPDIFPHISPHNRCNFFGNPEKNAGKDVIIDI